MCKLKVRLENTLRAESDCKQHFHTRLRRSDVITRFQRCRKFAAKSLGLIENAANVFEIKKIVCLFIVNCLYTFIAFFILLIIFSYC